MGELYETNDCSGARGNRIFPAENSHRLEMNLAFLRGRWCQRQDLNLRPRAYESPALPLSYSGDCQNAGGNLRRTKLNPFEFVMARCLRENWLFYETNPRSVPQSLSRFDCWEKEWRRRKEGLIGKFQVVGDGKR